MTKWLAGKTRWNSSTSVELVYYRRTVHPLRFHGRYPYSAITRRPDYAWPKSRRLAVYIGLNLEHFGFGAGHGPGIGPKNPEPDVLNYSWRDYGNRVGVWR